jgi:hypothetical protein
LQGDVAVAQVIGRASQFESVGAGDVQQLFADRALKTARRLHPRH